MAEEEKEIKKTGRPKNVESGDTVVNEKETEHLNMSNQDQEYISIKDLDKRWMTLAQKFGDVKGGSNGLATVINKWNELNPFLQNQRIKNIYTQAKDFDKNQIAEFLKNPGGNEQELRSLGWSNSGGQQIYYNILRRAADIPLYLHYLIPENLPNDSDYNKDDYKVEDKLVNDWVDKFDVQNTFKTIALEVKREGKSSYLFRNKFLGEGKNKKPGFCTLQKLPTDWIKITGKGELGYTISFNMMYFQNIANSPANYGDFIIEAWKNLQETGVFELEDGHYKFNIDKAKDYKFEYEGKSYYSTIESLTTKINSRKNQITYMFWLKMPFDICYTFASDNSTPWMAPDTMGLMQNLQELNDYGQLAGLIASTPLSAVLTGEIEPISNPRAGQNESVFSPEVIQGMMDRFNAATSTNIEAWLLPVRNIKLHQLEADVNASEIISTATENFIQKAGESGLTITTDKPNIGQVTVAKLLAASQQNYVTLQFRKVMNYILQHKLGFKYMWKIDIWGDIFNIDNEKSRLKEIVAGGNTALLPKLMSAEGLSLRDTRSLTKYIKSLDFMKDFKTYTQESKTDNLESDKKVGRPQIAEGNIENDATAASRDKGTNTSDNREQMAFSNICPVCGGPKEQGQLVCENCEAEIYAYSDADEEVKQEKAKNK